MDQWCSSLVSAFARDLVCGAVEQLRYPCCFNGFVKDFEVEQVKFITTKDSVNDCAERAKKQAKKNDPIQAWLAEANPLKDSVEKLLKDARTSQSSYCCFGRFPNWIWRYRVAKELAKKKKEVKECNDQGRQYIQLERVATLPADTHQHLPRENCMEFESREVAYGQVMEALKDDEVTMFGIWGMGGSGKTTMAMKLKRTKEVEHLFNKVLFVPVSSNVVVRTIQDKIASALQFQFPEDGEPERALRLHQRLIDEKRTLVILDDVWQRLDFGAIGIPSSSKVLITTRSLRVCTQMGCQRMINLSTLTDEEAWALFQQQADISTDDTLKVLGRQISDECKGLHVAIAALAGTLKGKPEVDWLVALDRLRSCYLVNIEQGLENPYKCLRVSYENLDTDEVAKSLLLLCSVFPEDYEIKVETLTIYAIGLGLVGRDVRSFEAARNEVGAAKNMLVSSSLLSFSVDDDEGEHVKMHDLIRDVALWIAREKENEIKCVLKNDESWESSLPIRYLWCSKVMVLNDLDCSSLEFLRLQILDGREVSDDIFKGMEGLRILHLDVMYKDSLLTLSFLKSLVNLRCLIISELNLLNLGDMSYMRDLTKLESLILVRCSLSRLPDVMATQLKNLKLLRIENCDLGTHPFKIIARQHLQLEELYCTMCIDDANIFKTFIEPQSLRRYWIELGSVFDDHVCDDYKMIKNSQRCLILSWFDTSNVKLVELAKKAEVLMVGNIVGGAARNIIPDIFQIERGGSMCIDYGWDRLFLRDSKDIECLVDSSRYNHSREMAAVFFSKLRWLMIQYMEHLGALYHGVPPSGLFKKLEKLSIFSCPALTSLLTPATARSLVQLRELEICGCDGLKHVLLEEEDDESSDIRRHDDDNKLVFPKLRFLFISECSKLEHIIPFTFAQGLVRQLESLSISNCDSLEYVFGQGVHVGDNTRHQNALTIELPMLSFILLESNPKVISIFPQHYSAMCPSLEQFRSYYCPRFDMMCVSSFKASSWKLQEEARDNEEEPFHHSLESGVEISGVSSRLQWMELSDLDEMKYICVGGLKNSFTFQCLQKLEICGCSKLEVIFPAAVVRCLPELKYLKIKDCQELKQIIEEEEDTIIIEDENKKSSPSDNNNNIVSPRPCCFPKLATLYIENCNHLRRLFRTFSACIDLPSLENFVIDGASELEELIGGKVTEVELPKLQLLVLLNLSSLCQGISKLPTLTFRVIHNCPQLSLTSSSFSTRQELETKISELEKVFHRNGLHFTFHLLDKIREILLKSNEGIITRKHAEIDNPNEECLSSTSDHVCTALSLGVLNVEESKKEFSGQVPDLNIPYVPSSPIYIDFFLNVEESKKKFSGQVPDLNIPYVPSSPIYIDDDDSELTEYPTTTEILPLRIEGTEATPYGEVLLLPKPIPSSNLVEQESAIEQSLLDQQHHELGETISIEDEIEESVKEDYTSEDTREAATPADIEGNGLGAVVVTNQTKAENSESQKIHNEIGGVCKGGLDVQPDNSSSRLAIVAELEAFKQYVDMDDAHIALLAEAIAVYPHLWEALAKFSVRFQAWMLKTLADMLFFLRNESAASITPQRLDEFQKLCNEAVQLGFDKPWIDEMHERVKVRDHGVDLEETTLTEFLKRRDELTQELCKVEDEIDKLRNHVDSQKKCFDFL